MKLGQEKIGYIIGERLESPILVTSNPINPKEKKKVILSLVQRKDIQEAKRRNIKKTKDQKGMHSDTDYTLNPRAGEVCCEGRENRI